MLVGGREMLAKRKLGRGKVAVTFSMPPLDGVTELHLVGDFNDWNAEATPLVKDSAGLWSVELPLAAGREYQYRYLANGTEWHNDWAADAYVPNEHGTDNSVVSLKDVAPPAAKKTTRKKTT
jgi:1,4-alpha-glucan branching enzyme